MQVSKARWSTDEEGTWVSFRVTVPNDARRTVSEFNDGKLHDLTVKEYKRKRSLDANAMSWVLIDKLSENLGIPPRDIYKEYVKDVGGNSFITPVLEKEIDHWNDVWCAGHYGRLTEDLGKCRYHDGYHNIRSYLGSSDYDTKQMSRFIDMILSDCKYNGIDVMTEEERDLLIDRWDKHGKE